MKKVIGITVGVLVVAALVLVINPASRDEIHWRWAAHRNETASYDSYTRTWPAGRHAAEAMTRYDELAWADALSGNTAQGFERYVQLHGEGKHVAEAKDSIEPLRWQEATASNSIRAYRDYTQAHPSGKHVQEAEMRATALRTDEAPFEAAIKTGEEASLKRFLEDFPGHQKEETAYQTIKDITEGRDIVDLLSEKKIEVETQGSGIQSVGVRLRRLVPYPIIVRVPVGSYFVSSRQTAQNMVTTAESKVRLSTNEWISVSISAACANRQRDIPRSEDSFTVLRSPHQEELARVIPVLDEERVPYAIRQAAVWIVTDNADYDDLGILVSRPAFQMIGGSRQINEPEVARAMKICSDAGIDIQKKAIWKDHETIYWRLNPDNVSKKWLKELSPALAERAKELRNEIEKKSPLLDKKLLATLKAKSLSVYIALASAEKGPHCDWIASFLREQGHTVEVGAGWGSPGVTVQFQEACEEQAKAVFQIMKVLFGVAMDSGKIEKGGISSHEDIVIWIR
ncbi:MAG: hypothetical protein E4G89_00675 [Methanothrix sp.]|nr:MAG: hypothetical protein E4G89_00675 [Methanothrix sp.]